MDPMERIAKAAEEIAKGLDRLNRNLERGQKTADLQIGRVGGPTRLEAVNLGEDGRKLWVHLLNAGEAATTISGVELHFNQQSLSGGIQGPDGRILGRKTLSPREGAILAFTVDMQLADRELTLRVDHAPGVFPGGAVMVAKLEPMGIVQGRPSWQPVDARNEPQKSHAAR